MDGAWLIVRDVGTLDGPPEPVLDTSAVPPAH
jgi:hypothetical protein